MPSLSRAIDPEDLLAQAEWVRGIVRRLVPLPVLLGRLADPRGSAAAPPGHVTAVSAGPSNPSALLLRTP